MSGAISRAHRTPSPAAKARKGRRGRKIEIGRGHHRGRPDVEERAIERTERQAAYRDIAQRFGER